MNSILKKIRQSDAFNEENRIPYTKAIVLMSLFTFVFLGAEFLFVNMISRTVSGNQSVNAQNYALGISVIGFVLYPVFSRFCRRLRHLDSAFCLFGFCAVIVHNVFTAAGGKKQGHDQDQRKCRDSFCIHRVSLLFLISDHSPNRNGRDRIFDTHRIRL